MEDRSVRVRIHGNKRARLTIKIGKSALVRNEYEYDLPMNDARELLTQAIGIVIEKRRFRIPHKGFTWEVDVYEGALEGLTVAEVEMNRETDLPNLPAWLGREITGDRRYSNQALATEGRWKRRYDLCLPSEAPLYRGLPRRRRGTDRTRDRDAGGPTRRRA